MTEQTFDAFIAKIDREDLRVQVEGSAIDNANDMIREGHFAADTEEYWAAALTTADMVLDQARDYFPELFTTE